MSKKSTILGLIGALPATLVLGAALAPQALAQVPVTLVLAEGDTLGGDTVEYCNTPFTNGDGVVGLRGTFLGGEQFIYLGSAEVWRDSGATTHVLTEHPFSSPYRQRKMGHSNAGGWIYAPLADGQDALWTDQGLLFLAGDAAPDFTNATFVHLARPMMLPDGRVYFVGNIDLGATGNQTDSVLYTSSDATVANTTAVLSSQDQINGEALAQPYGIGLDYDASDDNAHYIVEVEFGNGENGIVLDGALALREGDATGSGNNWEYFDVLSVNNAGDYLVSGDTSGNQNTDEFIAYNGTIVISEDDIVDGVTVDGYVRSVSLNNAGFAAYAWSTAGGETLFYSCDASDLANTSLAKLAIGDSVDVDGDAVADAQVMDFNYDPWQGGPGINLADDGYVYVNVDLDFGAGPLQSIIGIDCSCCGNGTIDGFEVCDDAGETATCDSDCTDVECGDGVANTTAGEACDDAGESATCDDDCTAAECGDGVANATAGEECDDGNTDDGDGCSATCTSEGTGGAGGGTGGTTSSGTGGDTGGTGGSASGTGGTSSGTGGTSSGATPTDPEDDSGCGCRLVALPQAPGAWYLGVLALAGLAGVARRRRTGCR